ncbi:TIGR01244 family sulfur transferase [Polymorphobacter sp.]|uniref:TIGR01244 family sulfur transferase n=1 Tax=Polymorphobacter sp. TaxID=1909290 RepID=UPI003F70D7FC
MIAQLTPKISVSPQITPDEVPALAAHGFVLIVNNRPDDEVAGQPAGDTIEAAARAAGLDYVAIPVDHSGINPGQVAAMAGALARAEGPVLAYCRSGTRSTHLWALAEASRGTSAETLVAAATAAGYDIRPMTPVLRQLAAGPTAD